MNRPDEEALLAAVLGDRCLKGVDTHRIQSRCHSFYVVFAMTFDPAVHRAITDSRCPECDGSRATPLIACQPDCPDDERHIHLICDGCDRRRVEMISPGAA
jgi:hypothetical protein